MLAFLFILISCGTEDCDAYYLAPLGVWEDGVYDSTESCAVELEPGLTDFSACCAPGYVPYGSTEVGELVCVKDPG